MLVTQVVVFEGDDVELPCNYQASVFSIDWKKGDDIETATVVASLDKDGNREGSDGGRITMTAAWSLSLSPVRTNDHGKYFCEVTPTDSEVIFSEVDLVIAGITLT